KTGHCPLLPHVVLNLPFLFHHVCGGINENCEQSREIVCLAMQQQETRLRRDSHADLIRNCETATSLEALFRKKHLDVAEKLSLVDRGQQAKKQKSTLDRRQRVSWKRLGLQPPPTTLPQQTEKCTETHV